MDNQQISQLFARINEWAKNYQERLDCVLMEDLFILVTNSLFNQSLGILQDLYNKLHEIETLLNTKSFNQIIEKDYAKIRMFKKLVQEFISKLKDEISEKEILVLKKISEPGWCGIDNYQLFKSFRGTENDSAGELEAIIESLIQKGYVFRRDEYTILTEKGKAVKF